MFANTQQRRVFISSFLLCALVLLYCVNIVKADEDKYPLSSLNTLNRVILLIKERHVEPGRIKPRKMLLAALDRVEKNISEVVVTSNSAVVSIQVGKKFQKFDISGVNSLWELSFRLRDIFKFIQENISTNEKLREVEYASANGILSVLDPHSALLSPEVFKEMQMQTSGEFGGLGIVISVRDGYLTIISPIEGTPADKVGLKPLDRIVKIGDESTMDIGLDQAIEKLRGKPGTTVRITVVNKNSDEQKEFSIVRDIIKFKSVSHKLLKNDIAYVKIKSFQGNTTKDVIKALVNMTKNSKKDLKGLILDLRNNPGGLLQQSIEVSDLFLDKGIIVTTKGLRGRKVTRERATAKNTLTKIPIILLMNNGSASSSEIVAGALKNHNKAIVIGEQSFGKGSVQMIYDFPNKAALKLTIAHYLTPGDKSIQSEGITPDINLLPIGIKNKQQINLLPGKHTREEDLNSHFDDLSTVDEKPIFKLNYLMQNEQKQEDYLYGQEKFFNDYEINLASLILAKTNGSSRSSMLAAADAIVKKMQADENKKVIELLSKMGIDWSERPKSNRSNKKAKILLKLKQAKPVEAGKELKIVLEAKNISSTPVWRLYGLSKSATMLLSGKEFVFGKVDPGKSVNFSVKINVPELSMTRRDFMRVSLKGNNNESFGAIDIPIIIKGKKHPVLSYSYTLDDAVEGNGDGLLGKNESAKLNISIKNTGQGIAKSPIIVLKNINGAAVSLNKRRKEMKILKPGESAQASFALKSVNMDKEAKFKLQIYDGTFGDYWIKDITLPIEKEKTITISEQVEAKNTDIASPDTASIQSENIAKKPILFTSPPKIAFITTGMQPQIAKGSYSFKAKINSDKPLRDVLMFVNDQKVYYKSLLGLDKKQIDISKTISLDPGVNIISLVARESVNYGQTSRMSVYSTLGDPLKTNK